MRCVRSGFSTLMPAGPATTRGCSAQAYMMPVMARITVAVTAAAWSWYGRR